MSEKGLPPLLDRHWAESALAIGAVIIAAVSLWVAYDSERTNRQLVASASWPFLGFYSTVPVNAQPRVLTLLISNDGIGPAKLASFELFWQGRPQRSPWQLLQNCCLQGKTGSGQPGNMEALTHMKGLETSSDEGIVIRAGAQVPIFIFTRTDESSALWDALNSRYDGDLSVRYCYCSAFNECWLGTARFGTPRDLNPPRVRACPRPKIHYDNTAVQ